jgi:hypothetical protein
MKWTFRLKEKKVGSEAEIPAPANTIGMGF